MRIGASPFGPLGVNGVGPQAKRAHDRHAEGPERRSPGATGAGTQAMRVPHNNRQAEKPRRRSPRRDWQGHSGDAGPHHRQAEGPEWRNPRRDWRGHPGDAGPHNTQAEKPEWRSPRRDWRGHSGKAGPHNRQAEGPERKGPLSRPYSQTCSSDDSASRRPVHRVLNTPTPRGAPSDPCGATSP